MNLVRASPSRSITAVVRASRSVWPLDGTSNPLASTMGFDRDTACGLPSAEQVLDAASEWFTWEGAVFAVLTHLLNLLSGSNHSKHTRDALCVLSDPDTDANLSDPSRRLLWLPQGTSRAERGCFTRKPMDTKLRYYPFATLVNHASAARGPLAPLVIQAPNDIIETGDQSLFLRCGGDAPIDFILAYVTKGRPPATIRLWMVGCKHSQRSREPMTKADVVAMQETATLVYAGMKRELEDNGCLKNRVRVQFDVTRDFWLFTTQDSSTHGCVITRERFQHMPWARYLFAAAELARSQHNDGS